MLEQVLHMIDTYKDHIKWEDYVALSFEDFNSIEDVYDIKGIFKRFFEEGLKEDLKAYHYQDYENYIVYDLGYTLEVKRNEKFGIQTYIKMTMFGKLNLKGEKHESNMGK